MKIIKSHLLFLIDKPEHHSELVSSLYCLKNVNVMRIKNMEFKHIRNYLNKRRNCVVLLFIENNKGSAMEMLHNLYNNSYNSPYIIGVFKTNRKRFLEHVKSCGIVKLFCTKSSNYSDYQVVDWVKKICTYVSMDSIFPFSQSYANSYVRNKICKKLQQMGMVNFLTGYKYIVDAVELYIKNLNFRITTDIYKSLSIRYDTAPANIDRCMRHAIEVMWRDTSFECLERYYPNSSKIYENRPAVLEFVKCLAEDIKKGILYHR